MVQLFLLYLCLISDVVEESIQDLLAFDTGKADNFKHSEQCKDHGKHLRKLLFFLTSKHPFLASIQGIMLTQVLILASNV
jgi:hypothetical protein